MIFYFYLVCFTFSISYTAHPFHLCFPIFSVFFLCSFSSFNQPQYKSFCVYIYMCVCCFNLSKSLQPYELQPVRLLCPWGFSRQKYWSMLPCPLPGNLPNSGTELAFLSPALTGGFVTTSANWEAYMCVCVCVCVCVYNIYFFKNLVIFAQLKSL